MRWVAITVRSVEDPIADFADAVLAARHLPTNTEQAKALGDALKGLPDFSVNLRKLRQQAVKRMHDDDDMSWAEVADALGMQRERAAQIARGISGGKKKAPPAE